jgi:UDP-N-acetylglucosamine 2-epimerase (non-hydrolysing)
LKQKIAIVVGTRPEIIKMSPIIRELENRNAEFYIIHSGQHYSYELDKVFFDQLHLPKPKYKLDIGSKSPGLQTSLIIAGIEKIILKNKPNILLSQGDTNTVLGASIAARKAGIPLGHVESGLRSYDESMPEEWNRIMADHISDFLFAPTRKAREILLKEDIEKKKIFVTGNTIVDAVFQNYQYISNKKNILNDLGILKEKYGLLSLHRQENVDDHQRFKSIISGVKLIQKKLDIPIIYPIHPRSKKMAKKFGIDFGKITILDPLDYLTFLFLEKNSKVILTDSGGVQEEACILKIPCVTLRNNTERPETVEVGANIISGTNQEKIFSSVKKILKNEKSWKNPFGDGTSSSKIIKIIQTKI